jgi:hypothetical protein
MIEAKKPIFCFLIFTSIPTLKAYHKKNNATTHKWGLEITFN